MRRKAALSKVGGSEINPGIQHKVEISGGTWNKNETKFQSGKSRKCLFKRIREFRHVAASVKAAASFMTATKDVKSMFVAQDKIT